MSGRSGSRTSAGAFPACGRELLADQPDLILDTASWRAPPRPTDWSLTVLPMLCGTARGIPTAVVVVQRTAATGAKFAGGDGLGRSPCRSTRPGTGTAASHAGTCTRQRPLWLLPVQGDSTISGARGARSCHCGGGASRRRRYSSWWTGGNATSRAGGGRCSTGSCGGGATCTLAVEQHGGAVLARRSTPSSEARGGCAKAGHRSGSVAGSLPRPGSELVLGDPGHHVGGAA